MKTRSFELFGKRIVSVFEHYLMSIDYSDTKKIKTSLKMECVTSKFDKIIDGTYNSDLAKKIVLDNKKLCEIFVFSDTDDNIVGTLCVMYKGGNDIEYKIRNVKAFIYNVFTSEKFRGNGYAKEMICLLMQYLYDKSDGKIQRAFLAVSTNNISAIKAYKKTGFKIRKKTSFVRIMKMNIPYRIL